MSTHDDLVPILKKLRLSGILQTLELRAKEAVEDELPSVEFLYRILNDEAERREGKQLDLRLRRANFDNSKSLEDFNFTFNPRIPKSKVIDLATCRFLDQSENIIMVGPAGTGKSHLAQAIGQRACRAGHSVLYTTAHEMFRLLRAARADQSYDRRLLRFTSPDLLIVDDLGLHPLEHDAPIDLYEIIRQRYERRSVLVTSNRAIEEWAPLFRDELLASAALDRLLHHCHIMVMEGASYRNPPAGKDAA